MYKDGAEVANIVFNGGGSDLTTWFDPSRIISSIFSDVTATQTFTYFSIDGYELLLVIFRLHILFSK